MGNLARCFGEKPIEATLVAGRHTSDTKKIHCRDAASRVSCVQLRKCCVAYSVSDREAVNRVSPAKIGFTGQ
jgi:hypothetical protein